MTWAHAGRLAALLQLWVFLGSYAYGLLAILWRRFRRPAVQQDLSRFRVSALKPLRGLDPDLEKNLQSFADIQGLSAFEVLLLVDDEGDAALPIARSFAERWPERFRIVVGTTPGFANPKVASLAHGLAHARHDLLWISDSNVETDAGALRSLITAWREAQPRGRRPTLIHAPLVAVRGRGLGARFERLQLVSYNNVNIELCRIAKQDAVVGKSLFLHRDDLAAVGGLEAFGSSSGEDYLMGQAFRKIGTVLCAARATRQVLGEEAARQFFDRQRRWGVLRKNMFWQTFLFLEPFTLLGVTFVTAALGLLPGWALALGLGVKIAGDMALFAAFAGQPPRLLDVLLLPFKEVVLLSSWVAAIPTRQVNWRGRQMQVEAGSAYAPGSQSPELPSEDDGQFA